MHPKKEKTFVILKPDCIERGLVGEVVGRFEKIGLNIVAAKIGHATDAQLENHYRINDDNYCCSIGCKSLGIEVMNIEQAKEKGEDVEKLIKQGKIVLGWIGKYIKRRPVFMMVLEGLDSIARVRSLIGFTNPPKAAPGTIRFDYGIDSVDLANTEERPVENLVHASGNKEEARAEIDLWFPELDLQ